MTLRESVFRRFHTDEVFRKRAERKIERWTQKSVAGCWNWIGGKTRRGYGHTAMCMPCAEPGKRRFRNVTVLAHRMAYALFIGDPGRLHVLHACDNPSCVNPSHLSLGTHLDNMRDMVAKGRHHNCAHYGASAKNAKYTNDEAKLVARLFLEGCSNKQITEQTGFKSYFVANVTSGRAWTKITGLPRRIQIKRSAKPKPRKDPARRLRWAIIGCLTENGPLETGVLAAFLGEPMTAIRGACLKLEETGVLSHSTAGAGLPLRWEIVSGKAREVAA